MPRPAELEHRAARRGALILAFTEAGERQSWRGSGWIRLDAQWVHIFADEFGHWQSWPAHTVVCIEWVAE